MRRFPRCFVADREDTHTKPIMDEDNEVFPGGEHSLISLKLTTRDKIVPYKSRSVCFHNPNCL